MTRRSGPREGRPDEIAAAKRDLDQIVPLATTSDVLDDLELALQRAAEILVRYDTGVYEALDVVPELIWCAHRFAAIWLVVAHDRVGQLRQLLDVERRVA